MNLKDQQEKYEKEILNIDHIEGTDIKINPEYYIHNAIIKAQNVLASEEIATGALKFRILIENIETLCIAAKLVDKDYKDKIETFETKLKEEKNSTVINHGKLGNFKLSLLMQLVFENKTVFQKLKL